MILGVDHRLRVDIARSLLKYGYGVLEISNSLELKASDFISEYDNTSLNITGCGKYFNHLVSIIRLHCEIKKRLNDHNYSYEFGPHISDIPAVCLIDNVRHVIAFHRLIKSGIKISRKDIPFTWGPENILLILHSNSFTPRFNVDYFLSGFKKSALFIKYIHGLLILDKDSNLCLERSQIDRILIPW